MLVRLLEYNYKTENDKYENAKFIGAYHFDNIDKIIVFIKNMIGKDVIISDDWYTIDDYVWSFPKDDESIPCLDVYVIGY